MLYSERTSRLTPSATLAITGKIKELIRDGVDAISFGAGEPDFTTPIHIREAAIKALREGQTGSLPTAGLPALREAVAEVFSGEKGAGVKPSNVLISNGSKQSIMNAILSLVNKDDEVLIPVPAWVSYPEQVRLADAKPVFIPLREEDDFELNVETIRRHITEKSKVLIINNPSNPTGSVVKRETLEALADLLVEHRIFVISDEIYDKLIYSDRQHFSISALSSEIADLTITTNGFSKTYAMTGWRVGYAIAKEDIIRRMTAIQSHYTSGGNHVAQRAALAALRGSQDCVKEMREMYRRRRDYLLSRLSKIKGVSCIVPQATFYAYPNVRRLFGETVGYPVNSSEDLAKLLLEMIHVGVVPGTAFGTDGYIRISYACDIEKIEQGMNRIESFLGLK